MCRKFDMINIFTRAFSKIKVDFCAMSIVILVKVNDVGHCEFIKDQYNI